MNKIPVDVVRLKWYEFRERIFPMELAERLWTLYRVNESQLQELQRQFGEAAQDLLVKLIDSNGERNSEILAEAQLELKLILIRRCLDADAMLGTFSSGYGGIPKSRDATDEETLHVLFRDALLFRS